MLDDLRSQANASSFFDEDEIEPFEELKPETPHYFLGLKPAQRFVISLMLLMITVLLSSFCLLATERMFLPFM